MERRKTGLPQNRFDALLQWQKLLNKAANSATAKNDNYMNSIVEEFIKAQNKLKTLDKDFRNARDVHGNALVHYLAKHNFHLCFQNPRIVHLKTDSNLDGNNVMAPVHLVVRYGVDRVTTEHLVTAILNSMNNPFQQDKFVNIVLHHSILNRNPGRAIALLLVNMEIVVGVLKKTKFKFKDLRKQQIFKGMMVFTLPVKRAMLKLLTF